MKQTLRRILAMTTLVAVMLAGTLSAGAEDKSGTGSYYVTVSNDTNTTGVSIADDTFHAFQIFSAADVTSYSVTADFRAFFTGNTMTGDDGATYNFQQYLSVITAYEAAYFNGGVDNDEADSGTKLEYTNALTNYNQLAGKYMDSYENNMYTLAEQLRTYLNTYGAYAVANGIECMAHATAEEANGDGYELAVLSGLDTGYYFIFDQDSTLDGLGVAASGAFVPLVSTSDTYTTITVKESIPTMTKSIYHDDEEKWDIVGDSQIGDTVKFRVISTLPSNIDDYLYDLDENPQGINSYTYTLTDVMSAGLTYDNNVKVYIDADKQTEIDATSYLDITTNADGFELTVDVISLLEDYSSLTTLYTFYSATLNEEAVVPNEYDTNTATLVYSSNPYDDEDFGNSESTVTHFTFSLDVLKVDESGNGLAGARFGLFDVDGHAIPLARIGYDEDTGVVYYCYDESVAVISDGGYITTEKVTLDDGSTVTGQFQIYGLNDQTYYTLEEVEAPEGYNTADQFDIYFTVSYDDFGTSISHFTDGSAYVYTAQDNGGNWSSTSTIINRLKIYLPTTGGVGTVLFQIGGGVIMLGAVTMLVVSRRKKSEK